MDKLQFLVLINITMRIGYVPLRFGQSYTVPILKNSDSVYSKSVTVDDFRGKSISPNLLIHLKGIRVSLTDMPTSWQLVTISLDSRRTVAIRMQSTL